MNILYTNPDPIRCADNHCNVHQVKMILEYAQLLSTAHHLTGSGTPFMYGEPEWLEIDRTKELST